MKQFTFRKMAAGAALCAGLLVGARSDVAVAAPSKKSSLPIQRVAVAVDSSRYKPATINVTAGQLVQLTFLSKGNSCANMVSIPALKKSLNLKVGQKQSVTFRPKKGQTIVFACGMKMLKGKVTAH